MILIKYEIKLISEKVFKLFMPTYNLCCYIFNEKFLFSIHSTCIKPGFFTLLK